MGGICRLTGNLWDHWFGVIITQPTRPVYFGLGWQDSTGKQSNTKEKAEIHKERQKMSEADS